MALASAQAELLQLLAKLPAGSNPYIAVAGFFKGQIYPSVPQAALTQLYVLAGVLGLTALLVAVSLCIRVKKGIFWIVRMQSSPRMIRPHATVSWATIAVVMLALFEVLIFREIGFFKQEMDGSFAYWILLPWGTAWIGGHTAAWSLLSSFILHLHATGSNVATPRLAVLANLVGFVAPVIYIAVLLPIGVLGGLHYHRALGFFSEIHDLLLLNASKWKAGDKFSLINLASAFPLLGDLQTEVDAFLKFFRATFIFHAVTSAVLVAYLVVIAFLYLSSLRKTLKQTSHDLSNPWTQSGTNLSPRRMNHQQRRVRRTLSSLAWTIGCFSCLGVFFLTMSAIASVQPLALISSPSTAQLVILGPHYEFAAFGLPCAILLVIRAVDASASEEQRDSAKTSSGAKATSSGAARFKEPPTEFSIQLASMPTGLDVELSKMDEVEAEHARDREQASGGRSWFGIGRSDSRREREREHEERYGQSVSVHVETNVLVEEEKDDVFVEVGGRRR
ncbi:hypothetical protein JCM10213_007951 [Rhodosporidiobolus nylandii]